MPAAPPVKKSAVSQFFLDRWQYFKFQLAVELSLLKRPWITISCIVAIITHYVHNVFHMFVYYVADGHNSDGRVVYGGSENRLLDLGYELFPEIDVDTVAVVPSNVCLYTLFATGAIYMLYALFFPHYATFVQMFWRTLVCSIFMVICRVISFMVTVLPSPAEHCSQARWNPPSVSDLFFKIETDGGCSDLIYSAHTMYGMLVCLSITWFTPSPWPKPWHMPLSKYWPYFLGARVTVWIIVTAEVIFIECQRGHYTVDLVCALYAVPLIWVAFMKVFPDDPVPSVRNPMNPLPMFHDFPSAEKRLYMAAERGETFDALPTQTGGAQGSGVESEGGQPEVAGHGPAEKAVAGTQV